MMKLFFISIFAYSLTLSTPVKSAPPEEPVESILCRGYSAVGFSYEWGGECWCSSGCDPDLNNCEAGICTVNDGATGCPECTHSGTYGADCSGFVSKAWQVPDTYATNQCDVARYTAASFTADHEYWNVIPMNTLSPGDAVASSTHVILVTDSGDDWGNYEVIEAKGCIYGIVNQVRTFSTSYSGARRINLTDCNCEEGEIQTENCGDCGTTERRCVGCMWSEWSSCEGPSPTPEESCSPENGAQGECARGTVLCVAGFRTCQGKLPSTEICDGLDNDCDGIPDNGTPVSLGEGYKCSNECGEGTSLCIDGVLKCNIPDTGTECTVEILPEPTSNDGCSCNFNGNSGRSEAVFIIFLIIYLIRRKILNVQNLNIRNL
ncbi:MAG: hypothetical protein JXR95_16025 [Deltaproteobacteria bacterium]|nr:hypothetical protein [Deltaproteobacteria bacterium]